MTLKSVTLLGSGAAIPYQRFRGTYLVPRRMSERANRMGKQYESSGTSWYELVRVGTSWYRGDESTRTAREPTHFARTVYLLIQLSTLTSSLLLLTS